MRILTTHQFMLPLPDRHRFPMSKYGMLAERVRQAGLIPEGVDPTPPAASDEQLALAHSCDYLERVQKGLLKPDEVRRIGFPWSLELVERSRRSTGATIEAARAALRDGFGVNLAGGTHHAFHERGEGYCVFNDSVVAARVLQREGVVGRVLIVDADVHQGNGTAALCRDDPAIFTFSIHGARNYPYRKESSDLDIALEDGTSDGGYLAALERGLDQAIERAKAEIVIYLAGADPFVDDRFGRLSLTKEGLHERDRMVFDRCQDTGLPVAMTMAGGYAPNVEDIVDIHWESVREAARRCDA
ncbi:Acetoin utilization protein AcuC [Planctomycetes bacterium Pan216]|uniref:Acetoin utilization protein AcuC n=1 Tax=Kolteria novifilia TaxID=2527975 RepID=A0A518B5I4_9BACT|nr:Acetoin utilization protein AcuC [Planctomycetes bacterium Pan216]